MGILFTLLLVLTVSFTGVLLLKEHSGTVMQTAKENYLRLSDQISDNLNDLRGDLEADAKVLMNRENIRLLAQPNVVHGETLFESEMETLVTFGRDTYTFLYNVTYYTQNAVYQYGQPMPIMGQPFSSPLYMSAFKYAGNLIYGGFDMETDKYIFAILTCNDHYDITGMMVFAFNRGLLWKRLHPMSVTLDSIFVLNEENIVLYSAASKQIGTRYTDDNILEEGSAQSSFERDGYFVFCTSITGGSISNYPKLWHVVFTVDSHRLMRPVADSLETMFNNILGVIAIGILITWLLALLVNQPLRWLTTAMQTVSEGGGLGVTVASPLYATREIRTLTDAFNAMMRRIEKLVRDVSSERYMAREMEQRVLQNQINAHFLCNSLQVIGLQALDQNDSKVYASVCDLSYLITENLHHKLPMATIRQEIDYISRYISIVKLKYEDKIAFTLDVQPQAMDICIPRLVLQPLVENAIRHGVAMKIGAGRVDVKIRCETDKLALLIEDNGDGMSVRTLQELLQAIARESDNGSGHIGLRNVYRRLRLIYGEQAQFSIESQLYQGTRVAVRLPCLTMDQGRELFHV